MGFFSGTKEKNYQQSLLEPEQQTNKRSLIGAGQGAYQNAADYYNDLLSNDSQTMNQLNAPEVRRFNEQTIPGIAEQFAGMGSGGLSSSGFRNAAVNAGTDLSERLGAIRANLRGQAAQGLQNIGGAGLQQFSENIHRPATEGFLGENAGGLLSAGLTGAATAFGGPLAGGLANVARNWLSTPKKGSTSPYGKTSGNMSGPSSSNGFNLPSFGGR